MKTLSFQLSKKLSEGGYLDDIDTQYYIDCVNDTIKFNPIKMGNHRWFKTLTLEEAMDFLPSEVGYLDYKLYITKHKKTNKYILGKYQIYYYYGIDNEILKNIFGKTLLEAIEKMLEYLLDKNLLTK